jgi:hypothetical protein
MTQVLRIVASKAEAKGKTRSDELPELVIDSADHPAAARELRRCGLPSVPSRSGITDMSRARRPLSARGIVTEGRDGIAGSGSGVWPRVEPDRPVGRARKTYLCQPNSHQAAGMKKPRSRSGFSGGAFMTPTKPSGVCLCDRIGGGGLRACTVKSDDRIAAAALRPLKEAAGPADCAGPADRRQLTGFQMMTFFVASSPGAGATLP